MNEEELIAFELKYRRSILELYAEKQQSEIYCPNTSCKTRIPYMMHTNSFELKKNILLPDQEEKTVTYCPMCETHFDKQEIYKINKQGMYELT